jgi:8-oxo-dGTP diphosphatase
LSDPVTPPVPTPCAGVVCFRGEEVLLIKRGKAPRIGQWSIPGGRIESGEPASIAAMRELREETGVEAEFLGLIDVVDYLSPERHYVLIDYAARWIAREPVAGDDAAEAKFVPLAEIQDLGMWDETVKVILQAYLAYGDDAPA